MNDEGSAKNRKQPPIVGEIADALAWGAAFFALLSAIFAVALISYFIQVRGGTFSIFVQGFCVTAVISASAIFLGILARDFRALKRWTYDYVVLLSASPFLFSITSFGKKLEDKDIRSAFGLEPDVDGDETTEPQGESGREKKDG